MAETTPCGGPEVAESGTEPVRPLRILVTYGMDDPIVSRKYANALHELAHEAGKAIARVNPEAQVLFYDSVTGREGDTARLKDVDALFVLGGADVDPALYNLPEDEHEKAKGVNRHADDVEIALVREARERELPILGICRGAQLINVAFGGDLVPDIESDLAHNDKVNDDMVPHEVNLEAGSKLREILGRDRVNVQSSHHQSVRTPAPGMTITAKADDGIVEAFEAPEGSWLVAVQWHPEDKGSQPEDFEKILRAFLDAAA